MPRKKKQPSESRKARPSVHERLHGFDIRISPFGEMESTFEIDQLNQFLNEEVKDKKIGKKESGEEE
jgi:hypothetical protein